EDMAKLAGTFGQLDEALPFYLGDLLNIAEAAFGEAYTQIINHLGREYKYGTLANYKSVCARVTPATRALMPSMGHCGVVAKMGDDEQAFWLRKANENEWTVKQLRDAIKADEDGEEA